MSTPPSPSTVPRGVRSSPFVRPTSPFRSPSTIRAAGSPIVSPSKPHTPSPLSPVKKESSTTVEDEMSSKTPSTIAADTPTRFGSSLRPVHGNNSYSSHNTPSEPRPLFNNLRPVAARATAASPSPKPLQTAQSYAHPVQTTPTTKPSAIRSESASHLPSLPALNFSSSAQNYANTPTYTPSRAATNPDPLATLPPALLQSLRESFAVLDRSNRGSVTRDDVAATLSELGLSSTPADLAAYFPPSGPGALSISSYLQTAASGVHLLDSPDELLAAFAAFDGDDSGQVDFHELKEAVLGLAPEGGERRLSEREVESVLRSFTGRRREGRALGKGEVFKYQDFVRVAGGGGEVEGAR